MQLCSSANPICGLCGEKALDGNEHFVPEFMCFRWDEEDKAPRLTVSGCLGVVSQKNEEYVI